MRIGVVAIVAISLGAAGCGNRTERIVTPLAEARGKLNGGFGGRLLLDDGRKLKIHNGRVMGPWVCGAVYRGDVCIESGRVTAVEDRKLHMGAGSYIFGGLVLAVTYPFIAMHERAQKQRDRKSAERRRLRESEAAERGVSLPSREQAAADYRGRSIFAGLANCLGVRDRGTTDGDQLAARVWEDRAECAEQAARWFELTGDLDKARVLLFVHNARQRYRELACGLEDRGLRAPAVAIIGSAEATWMDDYRAVVADPRTYDFSPGPSPCRISALGPPENELIPEQAARDRALAEATSSFPLTELPEPTAYAWKDFDGR